VEFRPTTERLRSSDPDVNPASIGTGVDSGYTDRVPLRVKESATMLGVSYSAMYEMIGKRQMGVLRLGDHRSIRIPKTEIERLLSENLVPALRE
jgi:excisionase family DNA binding protein